ncbi:hypothetical protein TSOC_009528 [Tetrabaena socialis]|uniref:30S ribosomal protein S21, chloroplastic n=1 Tax=Tetrabaena socialis TaxID=47790 RepID=A0A2J7ZVK7_9CHLO|nr:hypothetical protein TSOC_009528 [Tetrabaena socialis]|eukprot:PNH04313.1 hypothetical protein TSOC_009528 [Tetrabaena socialis]
MAATLLFRGLVRDGGAAASTSVLAQLARSWAGQCRGMAVIVDVKDNRVEQAMAELNAKREEAGIADELRKRRYYRNGCEQRFERDKNSYKKAVGRVVSERIKWVMLRRR